MAGSTTTTLNDLLPSIVAEAMFVASERSIMRGLVRNYNLEDGSGKTVTVPIYPVQTAAGLTEGTDLTETDISTSGATLTVAEVGISTFVTDMARKGASSNVIADLGRTLGESIARKQDQDLTALFAGFSNVVGSAATEITIAHIYQAVAELADNGVDTAGMSCVLNPLIAYDLKAELGSAAYAGSEVQNTAMRAGFLGMIAGVAIYESSNVAHTTGDSVGGLFHRDAVGIATMQDIQIEVQRDASRRGDELVATAIYGVGELQDGLGRAMSFDSTLADAA